MAASSHAGANAVAARPTRRARWPRALRFLGSRRASDRTGRRLRRVRRAASWAPSRRPTRTPTASWCSPAAAARIDGALQLLAEGRGQRLLISGVNPAVTRKALASTLDDGARRRMLACCVDLDREAQDTIGNATETRAMGEAQGLRVADRGDQRLSHAAQHGRARRGHAGRAADRLSGQQSRASPRRLVATARRLRRCSLREYGKYLLAGDAAGAHPAGANRERGGPLTAPERMIFLRSLLFNVAFYLATIAHARLRRARLPPVVGARRDRDRALLGPARRRLAARDRRHALRGARPREHSDRRMPGRRQAPVDVRDLRAAAAPSLPDLRDEARAPLDPALRALHGRRPA